MSLACGAHFRNHQDMESRSIQYSRGCLWPRAKVRPNAEERLDTTVASFQHQFNCLAPDRNAGKFKQLSRTRFLARDLANAFRAT